MFRVNLVDLDRSGNRDVAGEIPPDPDFWNDPELRLAGPVRVALTVSSTAGGQVLARGELDAVLARECRRCLEPVEVPIHEKLDLFWITPDDFGEEEDGELRVLEPAAVELDLAPAVREELLLRLPRFVLCRQDCRGLCPMCGGNRNVDSCECTLEEPDPRWEALRTMKNE
jgi:uncharacterized protein